jgi:hypothetical protein
MYSVFVGVKTPDQDGIRYVLFLTNCTVLSTFTLIRFQERRIDRCAISSLGQQTWQENLEKSYRK